MSAYFYDSSAISKHYHLEKGTDVVDGFLRAPNSQHYISRLTIIEIHSVFARKVRMRDITEIDFVRLLRLLRADIGRSLLGVVRFSWMRTTTKRNGCCAATACIAACGRSMPCNSPWPSRWRAMASWTISCVRIPVWLMLR